MGDIVGLVYAALVAVGGVMGFVKKGAVMPLVAGLGCGGLALLGAYRVRINFLTLKDLL